MEQDKTKNSEREGGEGRKELRLEIPRVDSNTLAEMVKTPSVAGSEASRKSKRSRVDSPIDKESYLNRYVQLIQDWRQVFKRWIGGKVATKLNKQELEKFLDVHEEIEEIATELAKSNHYLIGKVEVLETEIRRAFERERKRVEPTFSQAVRGGLTNAPPTVTVMGKSLKVPKPSYVALLTMSDNVKDDMTKEQQDRVLNGVKPIENKIKIKSVRRTKRGVRIEVAERDDLNKILDNQELRKENLEIRAAGKRKPRVIFYDVPADFNEADLKESLIAQNDGLLGPHIVTELSENLALKFKSGKRGLEVINWVAEVTPEIRNALRKVGRVYLGLRCCRVADFCVLGRCYKCQALGHIAAKCGAAAEACGHCAADGHATRDCRNKEQPKKCVMCRRAGRSYDHASDAKCPMYQIRLKAYQQTIDYGLDPP